MKIVTMWLLALVFYVCSSFSVCLQVPGVDVCMLRTFCLTLEVERLRQE